MDTTNYDHLNTPQNKARFFVLYLGQTVISNEYLEPHCKTVGMSSIDYAAQTWWLELKKLEDITDEDAVELSKVGLPDRLYDYLWSSPTGVQIAKSIQSGRQTNTFYPSFQMGTAFDYLRSKSYALPYLGIPVEIMEQWGWLKLKTK